MPAEKPITLDDFVAWSTEETCGIFDSSAKRQYEMIAGSAKVRATEHPFFARLGDTLAKAARTFQDQTDEDLFMGGSPPAPQLHIKPYESVINKLYRKNVLWNANWPHEPVKGWAHVRRCFGELNDLLRTQIVCKFIDGPALLAKHLSEAARLRGLEPESSTRGRFEGYYAYHWYTHLLIDTLGNGGKLQEVQLSIEIQLTTQLQDALNTITHGFYEITRSAPDEHGWEWDVRSPRFRAGYLSHTLHMLEGIILELREERKTKT